LVSPRQVAERGFSAEIDTPTNSDSDGRLDGQRQRRRSMMGAHRVVEIGAELVLLTKQIRGTSLSAWRHTVSIAAPRLLAVEHRATAPSVRAADIHLDGEVDVAGVSVLIWVPCREGSRRR
jgi:hypothetical protein